MTNDLTMTVPGISCGHCATAITASVRAVAGVTDVAVDIAARTVRVSGDADPGTVRTAIIDAGYEPA